MTQDGNDRSIVLDLRCLQDASYALRGIGRHTLAMLTHAPRDWHITGLIDPVLPPLPLAAREAIGAVNVNAYAAAVPRRPACFVMMSPMTHDPVFAARLLADSSITRVAVVYDFIPWRHPDSYLGSSAARLDYSLTMRWLARCDLFLPISRSSGDDLKTFLSVPESAISVTGCPIDPIFETVPAQAGGRPGRHLLVVGGGDPRKNPEVVIRAHARSAPMQRGAGIPLVIAGNYAPCDAAAFQAIAKACGGRTDLIEVPGRLPEDIMPHLYAKALAIICPSRDEGFDIPAIEGMAAGLPCIASDIPAHRELITDADCRFPADDDAVLRPKLETAVASDRWRLAVLARQAGVWPGFRAQAVAKRFWEAVRQRLPHQAPVISRGRRPRVALLSPVPPDRSGVADYSAATCTEFGRLVELHVFTETERPAPLENVASISPLTALPCLDHGFDRVIGIIGNSHFHTCIFEILRRYGGAAIAHDARMLGFYRILLGQERALAVASKEVGRAVTADEMNIWLGDEGAGEALFLAEIAEAAAPLIVHSAVTARLIHERYGVAPVCLPFSIYRPWQAAELTRDRRDAARARLRIEPGEVAIASFGFVNSSKGPEECIWALELLRGWGIPAKLHFVGGFEPASEKAKISRLIAELKLDQHVRVADGFVSGEIYRDYLAGADLAVQLRTYGLGGLSGGLLDCAAAGLATVANQSLATAVGVPDYVRCIPDSLSPLLLAEALADLLNTGLPGDAREAKRVAWSHQRGFDVYARMLCDALALDLPSGIRTSRIRAVA